MIDNSKFTYNNATSPIFKFGKGAKTILVLHGWGSSIKSWKPLLEQIPSNVFTTYFLELPGFGNSTPPNSPWTVADYANFVSVFIRQSNLKNVNIIAHSFGARVATDILSKNKSEIKKAIYIGAAGIKPRLNLFQKLTKNTSRYFKSFAKFKFFKKLRKLIYKLNKSKDYLNVTGVMKQTFINVIESDYTSNLKEIKIPVLLIWGKYDSYTPLWMGKLMHKEIPDSNLIIIPEGKHGLHIQNQFVILENINQFLDS